MRVSKEVINYKIFSSANYLGMFLQRTIDRLHDRKNIVLQLLEGKRVVPQKMFCIFLKKSGSITTFPYDEFPSMNYDRGRMWEDVRGVFPQINMAPNTVLIQSTRK